MVKGLPIQVRLEEDQEEWLSKEFESTSEGIRKLIDEAMDKKASLDRLKIKSEYHLNKYLEMTSLVAEKTVQIKAENKKQDYIKQRQLELVRIDNKYDKLLAAEKSIDEKRLLCKKRAEEIKKIATGE